MSRTSLPAKENTLVELTDDCFADFIASADRPVLVEFWAPWCGPCKMLYPVLARIAVERADSLIVARVDNDANPFTARSAAVLAVPTLQLYRGGELHASQIGARPKLTLSNWLDEQLS
ncbi:MAG: thioredoxin [Sciscionella sp.]|nr:thioredoxin [Sciscionella sp.]